MTPDDRSFASVLATLEAPARGRRGPHELQVLAAQALDALDLEERRRRRRGARLSALVTAAEAGLTRLRAARSSAQLLDELCAEAARSCGFKRVLLSQVHGDVWSPWLVHPIPIPGQPTSMDSGPVPLADAPIEAGVLASRRPELVRDAAGRDDVHTALTARLDTTSYVVAPFTPGGRAVGLLHADDGAKGRILDESDRDVLWTFAEGVGRVYERLVLQERLVAQRTSVRETFDVVEDYMSSLAEAEIELVRREIDATADDVPAARPATLAGADSAMDRLLTEREREVLAMMLNGHTNQTIAERLVIREGTVKSHVKHILRKTGATNRTEVISRYAAARAAG